jgi:hypothetical protein
VRTARNRIGRERARRDKRADAGAFLEPRHRVAGMSGQSNRAARFHRQRHDARARTLRAELVGQRRRHRAPAALAKLGRPAVGHDRRLVVVGALDVALRVRIPPEVRHHAVSPRECARADGEVSGAGVGVHVWIGRARKHGALARQRLEAVAEVGRERRQVLGAELIEHDDDDETRGLLRTRRRKEGREQHDNGEGVAHRRRCYRKMATILYPYDP